MSAAKKIRLCSPRGFCAGVRGALRIFDDALERYGAPIYVLHELVHNHDVTRRLAERGAVFVASVEDVPANATLLFGAHGVPPEVRRAAGMRGIRTVDATCPLVGKLQRSAAAIAPERDLFLFGSPDHPEMIGVKGHAGTRKIHLFSSLAEIDSLPENPTRPVLLSQTTRNHLEIDEVRKELQRRYPDLEDRAHVCDAVFQRQEAVRALARNCPVVLIAGSPHSSNAVRLREIAAHCGARAFLIDGEEALPAAELRLGGDVGVSSGASTPEESVQRIVEELKTLGFSETGEQKDEM